MFGVYSLRGTTLRFIADAQMTGEGLFRIVLSIPGEMRRAELFEMKVHRPAPFVHVEKVFPSSTTLPANLLKFYVHFSYPVRQTDHIFDQIHILDENGKTVYDPWRRFQQWSDDGRRLTLWIHPGRVKQGVNLREDFGPVLQPNRKYTLVVDADVLDLSGQPLKARFEKSFTAGPEDHDRLSLDSWRVTPPKSGTRDPLIVTFPKPLDRALMQRLITVHRGSDAAVEGQNKPGDDETSWSFIPAQPWSAEAYTLHVNDLLEDLAGNTPIRVFDSDMQHPATGPTTTSIHFSPLKP